MHGQVLGQQLFAIAGQLRPEGQGAAQIAAGQRVFLDADKVQAAIRRSVLLEQLPGTEKIQPRAKAGFTYHQLAAGGQLGKALGQRVLLQEHMTGLGQAAVGGKVHIGK